MELAVRFGAGGGYAHRITYTLLRGAIPKGLTLDHLCGVPACINPWHLEPVSRLENIRRYWENPAARAKFGHVRQLPSGRFQAFYRRRGIQVKAPNTFTTESEARAWLESRREQAAS
jgi:HNH endonuclease